MKGVSSVQQFVDELVGHPFTLLSLSVLFQFQSTRKAWKPSG